MGKVLPFVRPSPDDKFRGGIRGGGKVDAMTTTAMRQLVYRHCEDCGFDYVQPIPAGDCPSCHSDRVINVGSGVCDAPYRK